ncbi:MAG: peptidoglycan DD-metalloendopeptidase family protein [Bosea sp. (in: a-proteobacteria)]
MRRQKNFAFSIPVARSSLRLSGVALAALSLSACSSDMSRFGSNPFSNPFASNNASVRDPGTTGSLAKAGNAGFKPVNTGIVQQVQASPLAPPASQQIAPQQIAQQQIQQGVTQRVQQGVTPAMERATMQTGSLGSLPAASALQQASPAVRPMSARVAGVTGNAAGWTAQGGTPVVMAHGETVDTLSQRYGVPSAAILAANGLSSKTAASPGSRVVIPVYNVEATRGGAQRVASAGNVQSDADLARPTRMVAPQPAPQADPVKPVSRPPAPVAQPAAQPQRGMTAAEIRAAAQSKPKQTAEAEAKQAADAKDKAATAAKAKLEAKAKADAAAKAKAEAKAQAKAAEPQTRQKVAALPAESDPKTTSSVPKESEAPKAESAKGEFRWPARGRIINGFSGRGGNEGINIAVPEGTPVKAAEGGTVAYAGSELKGYGNLVLIRHDNGYVSAYAHNGDINVKRGEKVNRGQVIAKSGQSGNVSSPQLHFELRKGSSPVDPTPYLTN